jgi:hypothetical protein
MRARAIRRVFQRHPLNRVKSSLFAAYHARSASNSMMCAACAAKTMRYRVDSIVMAKISHFSLDSISRGETARAIRLAMITRIGTFSTSGTATRITKISHKTITIR